ncbi:MAG: VOC family protein [Arenicella sp.]
MQQLEPSTFPDITLSHFELYVLDVNAMETFYSNCLGFVVTDRGEGANAMVFLSRNSGEHHQLVLTPRPVREPVDSPIDHISFRVGSIANLRIFYEALVTSQTPLQTVSHGTAWSIYFRDPEGNRLELFVDTPWHVDQPCRFDIDFELSDQQLLQFTEDKIKNMPGFKAVGDWRKTHITAMEGS